MVESFSLCKMLALDLKHLPSLSWSDVGDMPTVSCRTDDFLALMRFLYDHDNAQMNCLLDLCVVDMLHYGRDEWTGVDATSQSYDRARRPLESQEISLSKDRFVLVYHLLSTRQSQRLRVRLLIEDVAQMVPSVTDIWPCVNWYEREAFDLFGVRFSGHPDLRRLITDYGFVGYPMRKDFPLVGKVEMRYDATLARCLYEPVLTSNRVSTPKVIRQDDDRMHLEEL